MNDDNTLGISADQYGALTDAGKAILDAQLAKHYSPDQVSKITGGKTPAPAAAPAALPFGSKSFKAPADPSLVPSNREGSGLSYDAKVEAFKRLQAAGIDPLRIAEAAKAEGVDPKDLQIAEAAPAERITLEEANRRLQEMGDPSLAAPTSPADYQITFDPEYLAEVSTEDAANINSFYRDALFAGKVPQAAAQGIVRETMATVARYEEMDEAQAQIEMQHQSAMLKRMSTVEQIFADAELAYSRLPDWFRTEMDQLKAFHSADSYLALSRAGALIRASEVRRAK